MDTIRGKVTNVIDGDTFDMTVTHHGSNNKIKYNNSERIRISSIDAPELNTAQGKRDKIKLENKILNKEVRIYIEARDTYQRIVGKVELI
jgi:endonuclease YncB( thermonuclease family)